MILNICKKINDLITIYDFNEIKNEKCYFGGIESPDNNEKYIYFKSLKDEDYKILPYIKVYLNFLKENNDKAENIKGFLSNQKVTMQMATYLNENGLEIDLNNIIDLDEIINEIKEDDLYLIGEFFKNKKTYANYYQTIAKYINNYDMSSYYSGIKIINALQLGIKDLINLYSISLIDIETFRNIVIHYPNDKKEDLNYIDIEILIKNFIKNQKGSFGGLFDTYASTIILNIIKTNDINLLKDVLNNIEFSSISLKEKLMYNCILNLLRPDNIGKKLRLKKNKFLSNMLFDIIMNNYELGPKFYLYYYNYISYNTDNEVYTKVIKKIFKKDLNQHQILVTLSFLTKLDSYDNKFLKVKALKLLFINMLKGKIVEFDNVYKEALYTLISENTLLKNSIINALHKKVLLIMFKNNSYKQAIELITQTLYYFDEEMHYIIISLSDIIFNTHNNYIKIKENTKEQMIKILSNYLYEIDNKIANEVIKDVCFYYYESKCKDVIINPVKYFKRSINYYIEHKIQFNKNIINKIAEFIQDFNIDKDKIIRILKNKNINPKIVAKIISKLDKPIFIVEKNIS